jgi:hypothetical protein
MPPTKPAKLSWVQVPVKENFCSSEIKHDRILAQIKAASFGEITGTTFKDHKTLMVSRVGEDVVSGK